LQAGLQALAHSDYAKARSLLERASAQGTQRTAALLALAQLDLATGRYEQAAAAIPEVEADTTLNAELRLVRVRALRATGKPDVGLALLQALHPADAPVAQLPPADRLLMGELLQELGRKDEAEAVLLTLIDDYNSDRIAENDVEGLGRIGRTAHLLRSPEDANEAYNQAELAGRASNQVLLWRAALFLAHHDPGHAEEVVSEVLAAAPHDSDALVYKARIVLEQAMDFDTARELVKEALASNPRNAGALAVLASVHLRDMQLAQADEALLRGLSVNPRDLELLSLRATREFLADDVTRFEGTKARVFELNPNYTQFFVSVGQFADWEHRYTEIVEMMREAVKRDPEDAQAHAELGINLIRAGSDADGVRSLQRAFSLDPYNVRVFNTLHLYERVIPTDYVFDAGTQFSWRYPRVESAVLRRVVPPLLEQAWQKFTRYYEYVPTTPVQVELYAERENFAIRTSGLPRTAIQGVCFGKTLAAMSPSREEFNLGMTVWHELAHVFHIQLSRGRVPRWFTEGLAEYETLVERREWRREQDPELFQALREGRLPKLGAMNQAFTHAEDVRDVTVAYYASSQIVKMLAEHYGRPKLRLMLALWGQGKTQDDVFQLALGKTAAELDAEVQDYLGKQLERYKTQFLPRERVGDRAALVQQLELAPRDVALRVRWALLQLQSGNADQALSAVNEALKIDAANPDALFLKAQIALGHGDATVAQATLQRLLDLGFDGYRTQLLRARIAAASEQLGDVKDALKKANAFDPNEAEAVFELLDFEQGDERIQGLSALADIDENRAETYRELSGLLLDKGDVAAALRVAESGVYADAESPAAHVQWARARWKSGDVRGAEFEFQSALACPGHEQELAEAKRAYEDFAKATGRRLRTLPPP
jgi:tetratricopeptide (TPR) repeat protein